MPIWLMCLDGCRRIKISSLMICYLMFGSLFNRGWSDAYFENYPESILLYWVMRYQLALRVVMSKDKKKAIYLYQRIASWETRIDETLVSYVKNANLNTYDDLLTLPKKFQVFLSNTIEPLS